MTDQELITRLQGMLDQLAKTRRDLESKCFAPKGNGCVCEGTALCAHHAAVYNQIEQAADNLAKAISEAARVE